MAGARESLSLPDDPTLAAWAVALNEAGYWAYLYDSLWRYAYVTDDLGSSLAGTAVPLGCHFLSNEAMRFRNALSREWWASLETRRERFPRVARYVLATTPGGRDGLRRVVDPEFSDLVDDVEAEDPPPVWTWQTDFTIAGTHVPSWSTWVKLADANGTVVGYCCSMKPAAGMSELATAVALADPLHLERMRLVESPGRQPAAILMADLEGSSVLARHLSTAQYFAFVRRLVRRADQLIIDEGGIVGRHAGDGVVAFFLAETHDSESAAARSCVAAARAMRGVLAHVARRSEIIPPSELSLRFGLHWGATLYMGRINTKGRSEVTALGDEMNDAARIEACATGARTLASKALVERLNPTDAHALGLNHRHLTYTALADLPTATDKARRDAPSITVCEL